MFFLLLITMSSASLRACWMPRTQQAKDYRWLGAGCVGDTEGKFQPKWHIVRLPSSWHPIKGDRHLDMIVFSYPGLPAHTPGTLGSFRIPLCLSSSERVLLVLPVYPGVGGRDGVRREGCLNDERPRKGKEREGRQAIR